MRTPAPRYGCGLELADEIEELYARVAAEPANLDLRLVLADLLQQAGDPRGELMSLQLAIANDVDGNLVDDSARRRAATLLAAHIDAWTAWVPGLEPASRRFERGFLAAVRTQARAHELDASFVRREWATVEELRIEWSCDLAKLVAALPLLAALHVGNGGPEQLAELARLGPHPRLRALSCAYGSWLPEDRTAFPNLRVVGGVFPWMHQTSDTSHRELLRRAEELELTALVVSIPEHDLPRFLDARKIGPPELRIVLRQAPGRVPLPLHELGWWIRTFRGERRAELAFGGGGEHLIAALPQLLARLAAGGIRSASIAAPGPQRARARDVLERRAPFEVRWERRAFDLYGS